MKRDFLFLLAVTAATGAATAQTDSIRKQDLHEAVVRGVKASKDAPFSVSQLSRATLRDFSTSGRELPFLLGSMPGVTASSDGGLGIGTSYLRIRGSADARINFTLDGVPLNDPEDQSVFWANMNSYAAGLESVQIQRGVGTSTNGGGAFGASVALQSEAPALKAGGELTGSYGSYGTFHTTAKASTGLLFGHLVIDGRYSLTGTDGYVRHTDSRSGSYYAGATWYGPRYVLRYKMTGNYEQCGQAWDGIASDSHAWATGDHRFNSLHEYYDDEGRLHVYPFKTTDNYWHNRHVLSASASLSPRLTLAASAYYVHGHGYYSNFKPGASLSKFGLTHETLTYTDFIREKGLCNDVFGGLAHIEWKRDAWNVVGGASAQHFDGNHYGQLVYAKDLDLALPHAYYDSDASKLEATAFVKASRRFARYWSAFADLQYRYVHYTTDGLNDFFFSDGQGGYVNQRLDVDEHFNFWNPKLGLSYRRGPHHAYASFALTHREPVRNNYTDQGHYPFPRHETLRDYEAGYEYCADRFHAGATLYYMDYSDQLVQTGEVSDIGEFLTRNVGTSYRRGIELTAGVDILSCLSLEGNVCLSQNHIRNFDEVVADWDSPAEFSTVHHDRTTLAFSPSVTAGATLDFHLGGVHAAWQTTVVGRQYIDNSESRARSLDPYSVSRLAASYTLPARRFCGLREAVVGVTVDNVFNHKYVANAWTYSALSASSGYTADNRYTQNGYFPMAGITVMGTVTLKF